MLLCTVAIPVGVWMGIQAYQPYQQAAKLRSANNVRERKAIELEYNNQKAETEINGMDNAVGIDQAARPFGWVSPGERRIQPPRR